MRPNTAISVVNLEASTAEAETAAFMDKTEVRLEFDQSKIINHVRKFLPSGQLSLHV
jgi:hypothetical protein